MLTFKEALDRIVFAVSPGPVETLPIESCAGRVLRQPVVADRPLPPADRALRDGIAIRAAAASGRREFKIAGEQRAGQPPPEAPPADACVEIMTGALVPAGLDAVVQKEDTQRDADRVRLREGLEVTSGQWIDVAGGDTAPGTGLLRPGMPLGGPQLALCASVGADRIEVAGRPRVTVLSTGDELVAVADSPQPWQSRRSNDRAIAGLPALRHCELATVHVPDDPDATLAEIRRAAEHSDLVVICGGVSKGRYDFVRPALEKAGIPILFHGVAHRPGRPLLAAGGGDGSSLFLGLPGNPLSTLVCGRLFLTAAIRARLGLAPEPPEKVRLTVAVDTDPRLTLHLPARLEQRTDGPVATPVGHGASSSVARVAASDGFVTLPPSPGDAVQAGTVVDWTAWNREL